MKKKLLLVALTALTAAFTATTAGCGLIGNDGTDKDPYYDTATVYAQAQDLGYTGTLEEFIALVSGKDGKDGEKGKDGTGVKNGYINSVGHLIIVLTDDREIDCGSAVQLMHDHSFSEWMTVKKADCTAGLEMRVCECGYSESKLTPAKGHVSFGWHYNTETEAHYKYCTDCNETVLVCDGEFVNDVCNKCGFNRPNESKPSTDSNTLAMPVDDATVSKGYTFGYDLTTGSYRYHEGLDFSGEIGTEVIAVLDGTVTEIVVDESDGTKITISHENGLKSIYLYVAPISGLAVGDKVTRGCVIGTITEPAGKEEKEQSHLHFELERNGQLVDPAEYLDLN